MVRDIDHLQLVCQLSGEPVDMGDHPGVAFDHQFQEAATVSWPFSASRAA